jgi:hypothetical protein
LSKVEPILFAIADQAENAVIALQFIDATIQRMIELIDAAWRYAMLKHEPVSVTINVPTARALAHGMTSEVVTSRVIEPRLIFGWTPDSE